MDARNVVAELFVSESRRIHWDRDLWEELRRTYPILSLVPEGRVDFISLPSAMPKTVELEFGRLNGDVAPEYTLGFTKGYFFGVHGLPKETIEFPEGVTDLEGLLKSKPWIRSVVLIYRYRSQLVCRWDEPGVDEKTISFYFHSV